MGLFGKADDRVARRATRNELHNLTAQLDELRAEMLKQPATETASAARKWEYVVRDDVVEAELDERDGRGWELVSVTSYTTGFGLGGNDNMKVHFRYSFKRPLLESYSDRIESLQSQVDDLAQKRVDLEAHLRLLGG